MNGPHNQLQDFRGPVGRSGGESSPASDRAWRTEVLFILGRGGEYAYRIPGELV